MRKRVKALFVMMLITSIILSGCSVSDFIKGNNELNEEKNQTTNNDKDIEIGEVTDDTIAVIVNKYNDNSLKSFNSITTIRLDDTEESFLIIPMKDDINIEIWTVDYKDNEFIEKEIKEEFKDVNKNSAIEVYAVRPESIPNYKIKVNSDIGTSEYYISFNGKNSNENIEFMITSLNNNEEKTNNLHEESGDDEEDNEEMVLDLNTFMPNGELEIKYEGSDFVPTVLYVKGNGTSCQIAGINGKGPFINVYSLINDEVNIVYSADLTDDEINSIDEINYLDKSESLNETPLLSSPIKVGTRWGNKEIVEVGEDLKIGDLTIEGSYIKTWEKVKDGDDETITVYYYVEGVGCVEHRVIVNSEIVEWSKAVEVIKK